jgi:hypothetical protein
VQEEGVEEGREGRKGRRSGDLVGLTCFSFFINLSTNNDTPLLHTFAVSSNSYPSALLLSYKILFIAHEEH